MNTLFDLATIPQKPVEEALPQQTKRFYVYGEFEGGRIFVYWKGHDNGGREGFFLDEYPRRKPHLWKTYAGAVRFAETQTKGGKVGVWQPKDESECVS